MKTNKLNTTRTFNDLNITPSSNLSPTNPKLQKPPPIKSFTPVKSNNTVKEVKEEEEVSIHLEPKVYISYSSSNNVSSKISRKIEIERKKRLYNSYNIENLLLENNINYKKYGLLNDMMTGNTCYLPLDLFDDTKYEIRESYEWIKSGSTPCKVLIYNNYNILYWENAIVKSYNNDDRLYTVEINDTKDITKLGRLSILFDVEDPTNFVARIKNAHDKRRDFESYIRYSLYIDSMPIDEVTPLDSDQTSRILQSAVNTKSLKSNGIDTMPLISEVNVDYARIMNKIIFDKNIKDPAQSALHQSLGISPDFFLTGPGSSFNLSKSVPYKGTLTIPDCDFKKTFSDFCFNSCLTQPEVISALIKVNAECLRLNKLSLFNTQITKSVRIEEFEQLQNSAMGQTLHTLSDSWITALKNCIKNSLKDVGKGWFNLNERNREVYMFSKLRKVLQRVHFMMEDSIRELIRISLENYVHFIEHAAPYSVSILSTSKATLTPLDSNELKMIQEMQTQLRHTFDESSLKFRKDFSLFFVELDISPKGGIQMTSKSSQFIETPIQLFDKAVGLLHDLPQLETLVMEHLFFSGESSRLEAFKQDDTQWFDFLNSLRSRLSDALGKYIEPLNEYVAKFSIYNDFVALDEEIYVNNFSSNSPSVSDVRRKIDYHLKEKMLIETSLPRTVWLGFFTVRLDEVCRKLTEKHENIIRKLLDYFNTLTRQMCSELSVEFVKIQSMLKTKPKTIDVLVEMNDFVLGVPASLSQLQPKIDTVLQNFDVLEEFNYRLSKEDFRQKWITYGWPKTIADAMDGAKHVLEELKTEFYSAMQLSQKEFEQEVMNIESEINEFGQYTDVSKIKIISEKARKIDARLKEYNIRVTSFNKNEILFGTEATDYKRVTRITKSFEPYSTMWIVTDNWLKWSKSWMNDSFMSLEPNEITNSVESAVRSMAKVLKANVIIDNPGCFSICNKIKDEIEEFRPLLPLVSSLRSPGIRERHWSMFSNALGFEFRPDKNPDFNLTKAINDFHLDKHLEALSKIGEMASKEYSIELSLDNMLDAWKDIFFDIVSYRETGTFIIRKIDIIMALLDEHRVMTQAMNFSAFKGPFEARIADWDKKLGLMSEILEEWINAQRQWMYLQPIFDSPDINKQLPSESAKFKNVNKSYRFILQGAKNSGHVLSYIGEATDLLLKFQECNKVMDIVQKQLSQYLDQKRKAFARFYFLSNDELLQILSQTKDPTKVQPFLKKCFENVASLEFQPDNSITAMFSGEKERVPFVNALSPTDKSVEYWLSEVEEMMKLSIRNALLDSIVDYKMISRREWVLKWMGQCVLNGSQFHWTHEVEQALRENGHQGLTTYNDFLNRQVLDMVELVRGKMTNLQSMTMGALIVLDVHARDVTDSLVREGVSNEKEFGWLSQLRYYIKEEKHIWARMVQAEFPYGYEYLGNTPRLVITPLTDRCYMTLMTALQLHLGGAPAGPAGTGKTESVKDMAKAVGKQCVVFNCSDGLDYIAMGKFFKGLAQSGAWACFDEFNRIDIEVLSVVAQQILTVWNAIKENKMTFTFEDDELRLDPTCSVFITMNPGYAGRSELPDNLKALFRPVAMMVPDYGLIAEISLYSFGFSAAKFLSKKMVATFKLSSEQLSSQDHYDYGMRAVKTVITQAGILKRAHPDDPEDVLILRALRDVNVPKFLKEDLPLFEGIISDLFPGIKKPDIDYGALMNSIHATTIESGLIPVQSFLLKAIQLYETTIVRHGLMVVGPTGGGKTSNIRTLQKALSKLEDVPGYTRVVTTVLNPKSITMGQLYGSFDEVTKEWSDGVLAYAMRSYLPPTDNTDFKKWIIFDGPVDAVWIENMNTVLDDNKKLCLTSGEIIGMLPTMTMMFEVSDLSVASPATVSRCGMVYMDPEALGLTPVFRSWLNTVPVSLNGLKKYLQLFFVDLVDPAISYVRKNCSEPVPSVNSNLLRSLLNILDSFFAPYGNAIDMHGQEPASEEQIELFIKNIEAVFIFALVWSVGATTDAVGRSKFDKYLRQQFFQLGYQSIPSKEHSLYDYVFDVNKCKWVEWMTTVETFQVDPKLSFSEIIVPTTDSIRYTFLLDMLVRKQRHVLFTGETGTGKTVNIQQYITRMPSKFQPISLAFSAATSANQTQDILDGKMEKRRLRTYGPPLGTVFVVFVDDMNMPAREKYFAQPPIELLRQWMDYKGWFDRKTLLFNHIVDIMFISAMGPPGGGRNPVTPRFLRHFNQIAHTEIEKGSLSMIFTTILKSFLSGFTEDVKTLTSNIVDSTIDIYQTISLDLRPTPSKSHYTFNLRDLSKVFQGMTAADSRNLVESKAFLRLWAHENRRVFADRLINNDDRTYFDSLLGKRLNDTFKESWESITTSERILFGDFMGGRGSEIRIYDEIKDTSSVIKVVNDFLRDYNEQSKQPMKLVMFLDAVEHVARLCRILRQPQGNALLLGVGGSGRQSLTRLACFMADYDLFQIEVSKSYGTHEWRDDLKRCLLSAGVEDKPTVFLFSDVQIVKESFLEDINNILNSGEVPNLYGLDDMEKIATACTLDCQRKGLPCTKMNVYAQFIIRVRRNLHIVLCMSPIGDVFRSRLRMFPSLVNCCTIDWFSSWPAEALRNVAHSTFTEEDLKLNSVQNYVDTCVLIHQSVEMLSKEYLEALRRHNYVTPTSYLELLATFKKLLKEKRAEVGGLKQKLQNGLDKLLTTEQDVAKMQVELREMQPKLIATQKDVAELMEQIIIDKAAADITCIEVEKQEKEAAATAAECKAIRDSADADLKEALPALDAALECVNQLKQSDIDEVKNFKKPTEGVKLTIEAACVLLKVKPIRKPDPDKVGAKIDDYWEAAQTTTNPPMFKESKTFCKSMIQFKRDEIEPELIAAIEKYITNPLFAPDKIKNASRACYAICLWVHAMFTYYNVSRSIEPKRIALRSSEEKLEITNGQLREAQAKLEEVQTKLRNLEEGHRKAEAEMAYLKDEVEKCQNRLIRAQKLMGGLGGEQARWKISCASLVAAYDNVAGDIIIAAGTIAYLGAFTAFYRDKIVADWRAHLANIGEKHSPNCNVISTLADPIKIRAWNIAGLPTDSLSTENGIIMSKARRWPLFIDPQGQANKFIKNLSKESENGSDVVKLTDKNFLRTIENAIRFGKWVLLENIQEELDPALEPLLQRSVFLINGIPNIKLGDSTIPYNESFKFFITTKLPNPHYSPELQVKVALLNFTITPDGLQDQMLGTVVSKELPEVEAKKVRLMLKNAEMKKQLQDIENKILKSLSDSAGDILDNEELINTLAASKDTSEEINKALTEAEEVEKEIDASRLTYIPVAKRASVLYFSIANLGLVDPMYQYSLQWFISLFNQAIGSAPTSDVIEERLVSLNETFTKILYENICRSLFEDHKLMFSFLLCVNILTAENKIDSLEYRFLVQPTVSEKVDPNPAPDWLSTACWADLQALAELPAFHGFKESFVANISTFQAYYEANVPHLATLPSLLEEKLNSFQKLLILRCLRPDKMEIALRDYVTGNLGQKYVDPPPFDLKSSFVNSSVNVPLIFVLSAGADPTDDLYKFAVEMGYLNKFQYVSLGQGQGPIALKYIKSAMIRGGWVLLQNCHLAASWLPTLEKVVEDISPEEVDPNFRLWLTSMPTDKFPVSILQNGVKLTNEAPKGLRSNLTRSYLGFTDASLSDCSKPKEFNKILYAICFFHAVILDRRKFGALGWNIPYQFTESDLAVCVAQLKDFVNLFDQIPYRVIHFLTYDIHYGGRVTDDIDRRTIRTILDDFLLPEVISDDYKFSPSGKYLSLPVGDRNTYLESIRNFSSVPEPEIFGLHSNADITCAQDESAKMFNTILLLLPRQSGGKDSKSSETIIDETAEMLQRRCPPQFNTEAIMKKYPTTYEESMNTVLIQESIRYNRLLTVMSTSLASLRKALKGEVVMNFELEKVANSLLINQVPDMWSAVGYPSLMPLAAWAHDLHQRCKFLMTWYHEGTPAVFWISGFFFPQAFLTGTLQNYARKYIFPIDTVSFSFRIMTLDEPQERPKDGCYIRGLFLEGARWDNETHSLADSRQRELFTAFPIIWLIPEKDRKVPTSGIYKCPVYKTLTRAGTLSTTGHSTNFIQFIEIPTNVSDKKWIKAGVALFGALRYADN